MSSADTPIEPHGTCWGPETSSRRSGAGKSPPRQPIAYVSLSFVFCTLPVAPMGS
jgi:hypothetical protein